MRHGEVARYVVQMATIITQSQLERIRQQALASQGGKKESELKRLKELSDARAKQWPNTIEANRAAKERARQERVQAEEREREEADRQEAALRSAQRQEQIQRAQKLLFEETDRVKTLHSKMLLCDVLQQNEVLAAQKAAVKQLHKQQDRVHHERLVQQVQAADEAELAKQAAAKAAAQHQKDVQMQQLEDLKTRLRAERQQAREEGELIRAKALQEAADQAAKEAATRAGLQQANRDTRRANEVLQGFKAREKEAEAQLEREIEAYAARKQEEQEERARRDAAKAAAKEAERQRMVAIMERNYMAWHNSEEARLAGEIKQAEEKQEAVMAERLRRRRAELDSIRRWNEQQLRLKREGKEVQHREEVALVEAWGRRLEALRREEAEEEADLRARNKQVLRFQQWQAAQKQKQCAAAAAGGLEEAVMLQLSVEEQEERFREYADQCLAGYKAGGRPSKAIELYVSKKREDPLLQV